MNEKVLSIDLIYVTYVTKRLALSVLVRNKSAFAVESREPPLFGTLSAFAGACHGDNPPLKVDHPSEKFHMQFHV